MVVVDNNFDTGVDIYDYMVSASSVYSEINYQTWHSPISCHVRRYA
jgi:hypothetical protein